MMWVNKYRKLRIRTNADQPNQATEAVAFGAEGIGLCRTEHMFFDHIGEFREMILATDLPSREKALAKLLPFQRDDFLGLFKAMGSRPCTIRCWTRRSTSSCRTTTPSNSCWRNGRGFSVEEIKRRVHELHESNPMLGHRVCRLGIVYPEITAMQARAIFEAAVLAKQAGVEVKPEVMVPLVGFTTEFAHQEKIIREQAEKVFAEKKVKVDYLVGTMIEVPRAAICADQIARTPSSSASARTT